MGKSKNWQWAERAFSSSTSKFGVLFVMFSDIYQLSVDNKPG
jgi:hypothetical protein